MVDLIDQRFDFVDGEGPSSQDFETDLKPAPETALFQAVFLQANDDAFSESLRQIHGRDAEDRDHARDIIRHEAKRWLTLDYGKWKEDRDLICTLAGLDSDWIKTLAKKRIAAEKRLAKVIRFEYPINKRRSAPDVTLELRRLLAG